MEKQISELSERTSKIDFIHSSSEQTSMYKECIKGRVEVGENSSDSWKGDVTMFPESEKIRKADIPAEMQSDLGLNYGGTVRVFQSNRLLSNTHEYNQHISVLSIRKEAHVLTGSIVFDSFRPP